MSYTKNLKIRCDECGLFCMPYDEEIPFGTKSYEYPEPLDPYHYCKKCFPKIKKRYIKQFKEGSRYGCWQKSKAEQEAAKECGLIWIHDKWIYINGKERFYCYITEKELKENTPINE